MLRRETTVGSAADGTPVLAGHFDSCGGGDVTPRQLYIAMDDTSPVGPLDIAIHTNPEPESLVHGWVEAWNGRAGPK